MLLGHAFETKEANRVQIENVALLLLRQEWRPFDRLYTFGDLLGPAHLVRTDITQPIVETSACSCGYWYIMAIISSR